MVFATICGVINLPNKLDDMLYEKQQQISYIINTDISMGTEKHIDTLIENGYENYFDTHSEFYTMGMKSLHKGNDYNMIFTVGDDTSCQLTYATTLFDNRLSIPYYSLKITENEISQLYENMTLEEFLSLAWYDRAILVSNNNGTIQFTFMLENNSYNCMFTKTDSGYIYTPYDYLF